MADRPREWQTEADVLAHADPDDPVGWFDKLYASAVSGEVTMPWDREGPHWALAAWTAGREVAPGSTAVVVGCGLGADAEHLAALGHATTAFDIADTAIATARARNPGSPVRYAVASLFDLPLGWREAFDLVVEIFTVQSMPRYVRARAIEAVRGLVAPGGTLLVIQAIHESGDPDLADGPPWPLTRAEVEAFGVDGLAPIAVDQVTGGPDNRVVWRAEFRRA